MRGAERPEVLVNLKVISLECLSFRNTQESQYRGSRIFSGGGGGLLIRSIYLCMLPTPTFINSFPQPVLGHPLLGTYSCSVDALIEQSKTVKISSHIRIRKFEETTENGRGTDIRKMVTPDTDSSIECSECVMCWYSVAELEYIASFVVGSWL